MKTLAAPTLRPTLAVAEVADQKYQWVMQGDDRQIYGSECAPLMHYIEQGGTEQPDN